MRRMELKQWKCEQAEKLGITKKAVEHRLARRKIPYPRVVYHHVTRVLVEVE